jgi:4-amino-4-deoxy-L-arabinose transferase-like glycosyltransferase
MDETMEYSDRASPAGEPGDIQQRSGLALIVLLLAAIVFLGGILSPPSLLDDVDAVQAQISRGMLASGDWVTARLDGIAYLEKAPVVYWTIAGSFAVFGVHDWAARIPIALAAIALCWLTLRMGIWAFGARAGCYAGLCLATCAGLFLFTRILIPDVMLTLAIAASMWSFQRTLEEDEPHPRLWAFVLAASLGVGLLLKSLIAVVFPAGAALLYLLLTRQLFLRRTWRRLHPLSGLLIILAIATPWHVLATLRNPPYFAFTLHSGPGEYHGFLWFFFINEQLLRFLNMRFPRDYNTVPRLYFWLLNLVWLFPWSVYLPAAARLSYRPMDRVGRMRLLALCWIGFLLVFFTFSTTQEYYSMPCYPALALLIGSAMSGEGKWVRAGTRAVTVIAGAAVVVIGIMYFLVRGIPAPGDISRALTQHPDAYTLALGHMQDLTLRSLAYLRTPLLMAGLAFLVGALGTLRSASRRSFIAISFMMVIFLHAARLAMVTFDPYLSSRPLAEALNRSPQGRLILGDQYYTFSSVIFYTNRPALILNGRVNNLEYGSNAPGAPQVFIDDAELVRLWKAAERSYLVLERPAVPHIKQLVGSADFYSVAESGGKLVVTNQPLGP